jgi:hypothetical protein
MPEEKIKITHADLHGATGVTIAGKEAEFRENADRSLTVTVPDDPGPGLWAIVVTTPDRADDLLIYDPVTGESETPTDEICDPIAQISTVISDAAAKIADAIRAQPAGKAPAKGRSKASVKS